MMSKKNHLRKETTIAASQYIKEKEYWLENLSGELVKTTFPYDYYKKKHPGNTVEKNEHKLDIKEFRIMGKVSSKTMRLSNRSDVRLHIILTAAVLVLLYKYSGNHDIIVAVPIYKQEVEGKFVNTALALRNQLENPITFKELLQQVRQTIAKANQHLNYPIETLLNQLNLPLSANDDFPIFVIGVLLENVHHRDYLQHISLDMIFNFLRTDQNIVGHIEYNSLLYKETTIQGIIDHFKTFLDEALPHKVDLPLDEIDILTEKEKKQILYDFNDTQTQYPADKTIHELFAEQANRSPDHIALAGLSEKTPISKYNHISITYKELDEISDQLAHILKEKGGQPDTIMAIMMERCVGMVIGILGILKARGAYLPIDLDYPHQRKRYMLADSQIKILVTKSVFTKEAEELRGGEGKKNFEIVFSDSPGCPEFYSSTLTPRCLSRSSHQAYILYTSGTTGQPKAVIVSHQNVVRLVKNNRFLKLKPGDRLLQTGALSFDASTFEIWGMLLNGLTLYLLNRTQLLDSRELKEAAVKNQITVMWLTSPLFNKLLEIEIEIFSKLDYLLIGGDVLSPFHINKLRDEFPGIKIINGYGPTENTTFSTTHLINRQYDTSIPIGKPISNSTAYILDKKNRLVPIGISGELHVGGDGITRGYLNNPELTAEKFKKTVISHLSLVISSSKKRAKATNDRSFKIFPNDQCPMTNDRLYKTGDLARWLPDGNIEFLGRLDHQVKIRGFRVEPNEIENRLLEIDCIKETMVTAQEINPGEKYLCAYFQADEAVDISQIKDTLSRELPDFMIPTFFTQLETIPLTPNGKVDMKALPPPELIVEGEYVAARNELEKKLIEIWSEVLAKEKNKIGIDSNFFHLGGHSLTVIMLVSKINKAFNKKIPLIEIFRIPTIRELASYLKKTPTEAFVSIEVAEEKEYYVLSSAQKRLYIVSQLDKASIAYNLPLVVELEGDLEKKKLAMSFRKLIDRHESLRTSFLMLDNEPAQKIHRPREVEFALEYNEASEAEAAGMVKKFIHPFDLSEAPLLGAGIIKIGEKRYILAVDMHHIISDGTSSEILIKDFMGFYGGKDLPELRLQYKDYSEWQRMLIASGKMLEQEKYWLQQFEEEIPLLNLPLDYPRPPGPVFEGDQSYFELDQQLTAAINELVLETSTTVNIVLMAVYILLLSKYSGQEDIVMGFTIAGRTHADLDNVVGMFVNMIALRSRPLGNQSFIQFTRTLKEISLKAYENQDYQFEELVNKLRIQRYAGRNPLFDVVFSFHDFRETRTNLSDLKLKPYSFKFNHVQFDLILTALQFKEKIGMRLEYLSALFKPSTIQQIARHYLEILEQLIENKNIKLKDISISHEMALTMSTLNREEVSDFSF